MKIGAWGFNDIVAMAFDKARIAFTAVWLFVVLIISVLANVLVNVLLNTGVSGIWIKVVDVANITVTVLLALYIALGVTASLKAKTKVKSFAALVKPLYIKQLFVVVLGLIVAAVGVLLAIAVGQISRIPVAGPLLMAILTIPFVLALAYLVIYVGVALKLVAAAVVENSKKSAKDIVVELLGITKNSFTKILFNGFLLLLPILTIVLAVVVILGLAYVGYVLFGWALTSCYPILALCMQGEINAIYFLETLSGLAILSYALSYVLNVAFTGLYSIYLDAAE